MYFFCTCFIFVVITGAHFFQINFIPITWHMGSSWYYQALMHSSLASKHMSQHGPMICIPAMKELVSSISSQKVTSSHHAQHVATLFFFLNPPCSLVVVKSWNIIHCSDLSQALWLRLSSWQWNLECSVFYATVHSMDVKSVTAEYSKSFWCPPQYGFVKYRTSPGETYRMRSLFCNIKLLKSEMNRTSRIEGR